VQAPIVRFRRFRQALDDYARWSHANSLCHAVRFSNGPRWPEVSSIYPFEDDQKRTVDMKSLGLLVVRLVIGGLFVVHGYPKLFGGAGKGNSLSESTKQTLGQTFVDQMEQGGIENTTGYMKSLDIPNPRAAAWAVSLAEFVGGLALILGFKTRPIAAGLAFSQVVAINTQHAEEGLVGGYELNVALLGAAATLAISGPGKLSLGG